METETVSNDDKKIELRKNLGVVQCVSYLISMIVGAGIFIVPNVSNFIKSIRQNFHLQILKSMIKIFLKYNKI